MELQGPKLCFMRDISAPPRRIYDVFTLIRHGGSRLIKSLQKFNEKLQSCNVIVSDNVKELLGVQSSDTKWDITMFARISDRHRLSCSTSKRNPHFRGLARDDHTIYRIRWTYTKLCPPKSLEKCPSLNLQVSKDHLS